MTFELFNQLPPELKIEISKYLTPDDLVHLAKTSKNHWALFQPLAEVPKFLHYVVRGEHEAIKLMLHKDISLIFKKSSVTDCSGRVFEKISGFEYALWALDKHMWTIMLECISKNEEDKDERNKVVAKLIAQYNKVHSDGVTYRHNGKTSIEKHFDFENTIIKELQTQVDSIYGPGAINWGVIDNQWRVGVGGAQKLLPLHAVYEYCSEEALYPLPKFNAQPKSSKQFYNCTTDKYEDWFSAHSKLGLDFAIYKGWRQPCSCPGRSQSRAFFLHIDLDAMKELYKVRTNDFINLKSKLEEQASLDNYRRFAPM
ncbi:F-box protein [Legionella longbeachae]|uniref:F-box protein n=1 Tax=Legionella longbeachae TaxID=450 RepID=UPI001248E5FA|nr:F-box protein [Legionella longbeachae]QEY51977.1 F-box protein [Legionella longbeachae]